LDGSQFSISMTTSWTIRPTRPADRDAVIAVVREAFSSDGRDGDEEVDIVLATWSLEAAVPGLDLVALEGENVVGHILGAYGRLDGHRLVGVAPLAVTSSRQSRGIGTGLVTETIRRADEMGEPALILLGLPEYYGRFGFEPAGALGISYKPVGLGSPNFLVRRLAGYRGEYHGEFTYCWEQ
jgi:predicted N-acetyltransferase YhbS